MKSDYNSAEKPELVSAMFGLESGLTMQNSDITKTRKSEKSPASYEKTQMNLNSNSTSDHRISKVAAQCRNFEEQEESTSMMMNSRSLGSLKKTGHMSFFHCNSFCNAKLKLNSAKLSHKT